MQHIRFTVTEAEQGVKLRTYLKSGMGFSSHAISSLVHTPGGILINGGRPICNVILHVGDLLEVQISDRKPPRSKAVPCNIPLKIVYEDEYLLVVSKPAGMVSLFSQSHPETPSVPGALVRHLGEDVPFHLVSRLDKGTTGLMVVAKSGYVHNLLRKLLHTPDFQRVYQAVCLGCPNPEEGIINLPIGRAEDSIVKRCIREDGAPSLSHYQVLERRGALTLLSLLPETGRTHQLRVHCAAIGHPLAGDWLYGTEDPALISRPALHSAELRLTHTITGRELHLTAPLPEDMQRILERSDCS